jgi:predicted sulfurtransferase
MVLGKNGKLYPKPAPLPPGNTTLLLFYAYVQPPWGARARTAAIDFTQGVLSAQGCTGRLRVALEGFNGTLTGPPQGIRAFCEALRSYSPKHFGGTDFKLVDGLQDGKRFRQLKVWPVEELVTYGFSTSQAPLSEGGKHVKPEEWNALAARGDTVMIDVRNANESAIGRFAPPPGGAELLDPRMRRSTEFADWVDQTLPTLRGKTVMMYCTGGVRWFVLCFAAVLLPCVCVCVCSLFPSRLTLVSMAHKTHAASAPLRCFLKRAYPRTPLCSWREESTAT